MRAHQPGSEPIDIPETIPNPVVVPKPTPTPTEPAPKEPVRIPEKVPNIRIPSNLRVIHAGCVGHSVRHEDVIGTHVSIIVASTAY